MMADGKHCYIIKQSFSSLLHPIILQICLIATQRGISNSVKCLVFFFLNV